MQVLLYLLCCYILSSPIVFPYTLLRFFCDMLSPIPTKRFSVLRFCLYTSYQGRIKWTRGPGKVVSARPPKRLAQLRSVSQALVSNLQKHRSKTSKLIRFSRLHFRDNWRWPCAALRMWLVCLNRKLYHKTAIFLLPWHYTTIFFVIDSEHMHCANRPFTYVLRKDMSTLSRRSKRTPYRKNVLNELSCKSNL